MTAARTLTDAELEAMLERAAEEGARRALRLVAPTSEWLDATEAAKLIGVSRDYLRRLDVPVHGSRRKPRYLRSEVEAFIATRR